MPLRFACAALYVLSAAAHADGPRDNLADKVRPIPPVGITLPVSDRNALQKGSDELGQAIEAARASLAKKPALLGLLPDVQIFHNAVRYALKYDEFYSKKQVQAAAQLLKQGHERLAQLRQGQASWTRARGLVVRGYVSKSTDRCSPMAWWCRTPTGPTLPTAIALTSGATVAARR